MDYTIQAKPTIFKGYRFRSRLEARWAVFFDRIGISWEYEPASIQSDSGQITPDFILNLVTYDNDWNLVDLLLTLEVKPLAWWDRQDSTCIHLRDRYADVCCHLADQSPDYFVGYLIVCGDPFDSQVFDFANLVMRGTSIGDIYRPRRWADNDDQTEPEPLGFDGWRFIKSSQGVCLESTAITDFKDEALYARQYDFMNYMSN